jgi:hypothetical protein
MTVATSERLEQPPAASPCSRTPRGSDPDVHLFYQKSWLQAEVAELRWAFGMRHESGIFSDPRTGRDCPLGSSKSDQRVTQVSILKPIHTFLNGNQEVRPRFVHGSLPVEVDSREHNC